jgi:hypothetical protein
VFGELGLEVHLFLAVLGRRPDHRPGFFQELHDRGFGPETDNHTLDFGVHLGAEPFIEGAEVLEAIFAREDLLHIDKMLEFGNGVLAGREEVNAFLVHQRPETLGRGDVQGAKFVGLRGVGVVFLLFVVFGVEEEPVAGGQLVAGLHGEEHAPPLEQHRVVITGLNKKSTRDSMKRI